MRRMLFNQSIKRRGEVGMMRSWKALEIVWVVSRAVTRPLLKTNQPLLWTGTNISLITGSGHRGSYRERKTKNWISKNWNQDGDEFDLQQTLNLFLQWFCFYYIDVQNDTTTCSHDWKSLTKKGQKGSGVRFQENLACLFPRKLMHILPYH